MPTAAAHRDFHTTRWSLISQMRATGDSTGAHAALSELCQRYWQPLFSFMQRSGASAADAEDMTQGFFQHLLTHDIIERAGRERGRFRSYLLGCLKHYMGNQWQRANAQRRGSPQAPIQLDALAPDERDHLEQAEALSSSTADSFFDQQWAHSVLDQAIARLRAECGDDAARERLELLIPTLTGTEDRATILSRTGLSEGALKVSVHRLRKRYRQHLHDIIADTVEHPSDVDDELAYLVTCLRS